MSISDDFAWSHLRAVLAVADAGSLSAAAREIGQSQPTLGRHIRAAEEAFGQPLFQRHRRGLSPTPFCERILPFAREMEANMRRLSLVAAGEQPTLAGRVRLTASIFVTTYILPPILAQIRQNYPQIKLDVVASDTTENLLFHEADIALRMYRPNQLDMITRHLGDLPLALYAADSYLAKHGTPTRPEEIYDHAMVGYDRDDQIILGMRDLGFHVDRDFFVACTDNQVAYWNFVVAGCGIGIGQCAVANRTPGVSRILPEMQLPVLPVWLTAHPALRHQPRIDAVWRALDRAIAPLLS